MDERSVFYILGIDSATLNTIVKYDCHKRSARAEH